MSEDVQTYAARVAAAADPDGRLGIDPQGAVGCDVFPFEVEGLRLKPGPTLVAEEVPRSGEDPADRQCARPDDDGDRSGWATVWEDGDWRLRVAPPSGAPLVLSLVPHRHLDVPDLPDEVRDANAAFVVERLVAELGGRAVRG